MSDYSRMLSPTAKTKAFRVYFPILVLVAWCGMMALYFTAYDLLEQRAVPVSLPSKTFSTQNWDRGYFHASGAYENQSAIVRGDELLPQANSISCVKETKTCTIATGQIFDRFLDVDDSSFDIASWTDQQITFTDDSPICVTNSYVIDRAAQTMTLLVRKRAVIPDYAAKSELHPCDNIKDANIDLADGFKVYWRRKTDFEARNGLSFHAVLAVMNLLFFGAVAWFWRRSKATMHS